MYWLSSGRYLRIKRGTSNYQPSKINKLITSMGVDGARRNADK